MLNAKKNRNLTFLRQTCANNSSCIIIKRRNGEQPRPCPQSRSCRPILAVAGVAL